MKQDRVSFMIHSAKPTVSPVAKIVFTWNLSCFWKVGTDGRHVRKQWALPAVTAGRPRGSILLYVFLWSYLCDDFIINDTPGETISSIRQGLSIHQDNADEIINNHDDEEEDTEVVIRDQSEDSRQPEVEISQPKKSERSLRSRRKRSKSSSRSGVENHQPPANKKSKPEQQSQEKKLKNLVGLRNLGNTCFMSAVLQSLR